MKKHTQIIIGIIGSLLAWGSAILISGHLGERQILGYSSLPLGKIHIVLILAWNIAVAIYCKKREYKCLFFSSFAVMVIPSIGYFLMMLAMVVPFLNFLSYVVYWFTMPFLTPMVIYSDSVGMIITAAIIYVLSPLLGLIIYKNKKHLNKSEQPKSECENFAD